MARYIPIGTPVNDAEVVGIRVLRDSLPSHFTVVGNFELRIPNRANTFEFDVVVIGEHAIYTVEIKGWSGHIVGDSRHWRLEWGRVDNPFLLLESKTKALRGFLSTQVRDLPEAVTCRSFLFLPRDVTLEVEDPGERIITLKSDIHEMFVDRTLIELHGPGVLLEESLRLDVEAVLLPAATPASAPVVISDYHIERELDSGNELYREFIGRHTLLTSRNRVRIKRYSLDPLLAPHERQSAFDRVMREMEAITMLDSNPYIAAGFDVIRDRDDELNFYLVSEWVGERTLQDVATSTEPLFDEDLTHTRHRLAAHLLRAIDFMHRRGIVHRNLNLEVIFVTDDPLVPLKVTDFEYARIQNMPSIVGDFSDLGTIGFVAPELWKGHDHDHRVDVFSCGAILFELLSGAQLFDTLGEVADPQKTFANKAELIDDVELRDAVRSCLMTDPNDRPDNLEALAERFDARL